MSKKNVNVYDLSGDYGIGYTSKGVKFLFDKEDYQLVSQHNWYQNSNGYIRSSHPYKVFLHRLVMGGSQSDIMVDHIHHDKTDNRKSELRIVVNTQNQMNQQPRVHSSKYTGVSWHVRDKKWIAQISVGGKLKYLGAFKNEEDAIKARKEAEKIYYGQYSYNQ